MKDLQLMRKWRFKSFSKNSSRKLLSFGFTLIEVVIIVAILVLITGFLLFRYQKNLMRARDAARKSDLDKIKASFEEYYNDHGCYPPPHFLSDCGTEGGSGVGDPSDPDYMPHLYPYYLKSIPCDPLTREPYLYQSLSGDYCDGYRLLAKLEVTDDKDITGVGCNIENGCDANLDPAYNWGIASGGSVSNQNWETGGDGEVEGLYYCTPYLSEDLRYQCSTLSWSERQAYFELTGCKSYETQSACQIECHSDGVNMDPGVACECEYGSTYTYCD